LDFTTSRNALLQQAESLAADADGKTYAGRVEHLQAPERRAWESGMNR
jgi:hypothetical protein